MPIICGSDLSPASTGALEVACALARQRGDAEVVLLHVVPDELDDEARAAVVAQLDAQAAHRPPGGESFLDVCQRIGPAVREMAAAGDVTVVAHAGTVRAALALAVGPTAALAFEVAPLSVTRLRALPGGGWAIAEVNWTAP